MQYVSGKLVDRGLDRALSSLDLCLQRIFSFRDLKLGSLLGLCKRGIALLGPLLLLLLPRLENPGSGRTQVRLVLCCFGRRRGSGCIGLFNSSSCPRAALSQNLGERPVNQKAVSR